MGLRKGDAHVCSRPVSISFRKNARKPSSAKRPRRRLCPASNGAGCPRPPGVEYRPFHLARLTKVGAGAPGIRLHGSYYRLGMSANPARISSPCWIRQRHWARLHPLVGRAEGIGCPVPAGIRTDGRRDANSCRAGRRTGDYPDPRMPRWHPDGRLSLLPAFRSRRPAGMSKCTGSLISSVSFDTILRQPGPWHPYRPSPCFSLMPGAVIHCGRERRTGGRIWPPSARRAVTMPCCSNSCTTGVSPPCVKQRRP